MRTGLRECTGLQAHPSRLRASRVLCKPKRARPPPERGGRFHRRARVAAADPKVCRHGGGEEAINHGWVEATAKAALGFVVELEKARHRIPRHPSSGSPRHPHQSGLADLRLWPLGRCPDLDFQVERDETVDVWRVRQLQRDTPAWMKDDGELPTHERETRAPGSGLARAQWARQGLIHFTPAQPQAAVPSGPAG